MTLTCSLATITILATGYGLGLSTAVWLVCFRAAGKADAADTTHGDVPAIPVGMIGDQEGRT